MSLQDDVYRNKFAECLRAFYAAKYVREDNTPCKIEEGLFLGSIGVSYNKEALKAQNVTHVLIVAKSLEPAFPNDFTYKKISALDTRDENLQQYFDDCFAFIDQAREAGGGVLVHCFAGRSRSVTVLAAYMMKKHRMSLFEVMNLIRSKRPQIAPNMGFIAQLANHEKSIRDVPEASAQ